MKNKIITSEQAIKLINDGDTVAIFIYCEEFYEMLEKVFLERGHPRDLTLIAAVIVSDLGNRGGNRLIHEGLLKRVITSHVGIAHKLARSIYENNIQAQFIPMGQLVKLYLELAQGKEGIISKIGLNTFVDPRQGGGKQNELTKEKGEDLIELINLDGEEFLSYHLPKIDTAFIKASIADEMGNLTFDKEITYAAALPMAMAVKRMVGTVIAQVGDIAKAGTLSPKDIVVPHIFVDKIFRAKPENQFQSYWHIYEPAISGEIKTTEINLRKLPLDIEKIGARRAAIEIKPGAICNFGYGLPSFALSIAGVDENITPYFTPSIELGIIGGDIDLLEILPFGPLMNPDSIIDITEMFDFIEGGGLDMAFLALAQMDKQGNVNVSRFGPSIVGSGGFVDISSSTKNVIYVGTFTAGKMDIEVNPKGLKIKKDGQSIKFVKRVEEITFNGQDALKRGQNIMAITERAVFRLEKGGLKLIEIAPGVDLQKHILDKMEFKPIIADDLIKMDLKLFQPAPMGLREEFEKR